MKKRGLIEMTKNKIIIERRKSDFRPECKWRAKTLSRTGLFHSCAMGKTKTEAVEKLKRNLRR